MCCKVRPPVKTDWKYIDGYISIYEYNMPGRIIRAVLCIHSIFISNYTLNSLYLCLEDISLLADCMCTSCVCDQHTLQRYVYKSAKLLPHIRRIKFSSFCLFSFDNIYLHLHYMTPIYLLCSSLLCQRRHGQQRQQPQAPRGYPIMACNRATRGCSGRGLW